MASYYLELLRNPLTFPPVSKDINVFFDECQKHVFAVSNDNENTHVQAMGHEDNLNAKFLLQNKGRVISIKFSPNRHVLAIQRSDKFIDFVNFHEGEKFEEYSQTCKGRSTKVIGFCWTGDNDIVFITSQGLEFYYVQSNKFVLKLIKNYHIAVKWFVFLPDVFVLLLSSGDQSNVIHPYVFKNGIITRLPRFEVENPPSTRNPQPSALVERDVTIASIYNKIYVVVLRNHPCSFNTVGAEIVLYQLQKDTAAKKTAVLRLGAVGRFAVNVVDNLIAVHHQASKTSMIFDINMQGDFDGQVTFYHPVLSPLPIEPNNPIDKKTLVCDYYSPNWVVFQPNIIIDAKLGCLWKLQVKLDCLVNMMDNKVNLVDFLLLRTESKAVIISVFNQMLTPHQKCSLSILAQIFDKINSAYAEFLELNNATGNTQAQESTQENELTGNWLQYQPVIEQSDIYVGVFQPFSSVEESCKTVIAVILEYIRSLNSHKIPVEYYLNEFVVKLLVKKKLYYQLHQFLQYHVLSDSKSLAFLLLSLGPDYPSAYHLALDMLKRLGNNQEDIIEVLLAKDNVISALKSLQQNDLIDSAAPRKFLEAAVNTGDDIVFHSVFTFFKQRNYKLRKNTKFVRGEQCESFEIVFDEKFSKIDHPLESISEKLESLQI